MVAAGDDHDPLGMVAVPYHFRVAEIPAAACAARIFDDGAAAIEGPSASFVIAVGETDFLIAVRLVRIEGGVVGEQPRTAVEQPGNVIRIDNRRAGP